MGRLLKKTARGALYVLILFGLPTLFYGATLFGLFYGERDQIKYKAAIERGVVAEAVIVRLGGTGDYEYPGTIYVYTDKAGVQYTGTANESLTREEATKKIGSKIKIYLGENGVSVPVGYQLTYNATFNIVFITVITIIYLGVITVFFVITVRWLKKKNKSITENAEGEACAINAAVTEESTVESAVTDEAVTETVETEESLGTHRL